MKKIFHTNIGPFMRSNKSTNKIMNDVVIALIPIIIFSFYKNGIIPFIHHKTNIIGLFYPLLFILITTLASFSTELFYYKFIKKIKDDDLKDMLNKSFSIMPGLFLGLILPINTPIIIAVAGSFLASFIGKIVYGGFGNNIFNPALIGRLFIISAYAIVISNHGGYLNSYEIDTISSSTPLSNSSVVDGIGTYDSLVKPYGSLWDFFIGTIPGSIGETSAILCLLGFIYLSLKKVIKSTIPLIYITTVFIMTFLIGGINGLGVWYPLFQILSGGLMFGSIFMATDPVTSPTTFFGQLLYGLFLGILTVLFRYLTPYPEGVLTSILTMNMMVFILDNIGSKVRFNKKYLYILLIPLIIIIVSSIIIGNSYNKETTNIDLNYNIISKDNKNKTTTYVVTEKSFGGNIKAKLKIENDKIVSCEILEVNDSYFNKIIDSKYIDKLIKEQDIINDVDTVSGATISSTSLKKIFVNTLNDFKNNSNNTISKNDDFIKEKVDGGYVYTITEKSFGGNMKVKVTIISSVIKSVEMINNNDSYYQKIVDANYLNEFHNVGEIDDIDTVSGATISSRTIKKIVSMALADYRS